jgi:hypothetical protein
MGFITVAGETLIAQKQGASQVLSITNFVLANIPGLGAEPPDRIPTIPTVGQIVDTRAVTRAGYVQTNQVVYSLTMDSNVGDYFFNWIGLQDIDGNFIAVSYIPLIEKRKTNGSVQGNNLTRSFLIEYSGIAATAAVSVPAETWQIDFTARLLGIDERERLSNFDIYGHQSFFDTAFSVSLQAGDVYDIAAGIAYVGGIRCESVVVSTVTAATKPTSIWMDVSLQGDVSDVSAVITFTVNAAVQNDYIDGLGFNHYIAKLADIAADGSVTDARFNLGGLDMYVTKAELDATLLDNRARRIYFANL